MFTRPTELYCANAGHERCVRGSKSGREVENGLRDLRIKGKPEKEMEKLSKKPWWRKLSGNADFKARNSELS